MYLKKHRHIFYFGFCLFFILAIGFMGISGRNETRSFLATLLGKTHNSLAIVLTEEGFNPKKIIIQKGDTVIFTTTRQAAFWPASDLHPTHDIYSEFDPKQPVEPQRTWSFTFTKIGEWRYHDHLAPLFRGTITVIDGQKLPTEQQLSNIDTLDQCKIENYGNKVKCWENALANLLVSEGLDTALGALALIFEKEPELSGDCHGLAHRLGEETYKLFSQNKKVTLSPKSSSCAYGFYHGFMETLLYATNDVVKARTFCDYADAELRDRTIDARGACYHGIGHGLVEDMTNPKVWGNAQAIAEPGLKTCKRVADDPHYLFRCVSGVFNALEIVSTQNKYGLSLNQTDPFWICRKQKENYKEACFTQFLVAAINVAKSDFLKTVKFINTIEENQYALPTLAGLAVERIRLGHTDHKDTVMLCRSLELRFRVPCITGFAEGFLKYGPPQNEYKEAIRFCNSELLRETEKNACFERVLSILRIWYSVEKSAEICNTVDKKYQWQNCNYR